MCTKSVFTESANDVCMLLPCYRWRNHVDLTPTYVEQNNISIYIYWHVYVIVNVGQLTISLSNMTSIHLNILALPTLYLNAIIIMLMWHVAYTCFNVSNYEQYTLYLNYNLYLHTIFDQRRLDIIDQVEHGRSLQQVTHSTPCAVWW